jgi:hypothetical protein
LICQSSKMFGFDASRLFDEWSKMRSGIREKRNRRVEFKQCSISKYLEHNRVEEKIKLNLNILTRMRSLSITVRKRWATVRTVHTLNLSRMVRCINSSVLYRILSLKVSFRIPKSKSERNLFSNWWILYSY